MLPLKRAGIISKKHILDSKLSENTKDMIHNEYNMEMELVWLGCHRQNTAKVAKRHCKVHFLSLLADVTDNFLVHLWDRLLPQTKIME